jgi:N-acyl-D-amino-acid deacylase
LGGASADLVRFVCAFDDPSHCPILQPASVAAMFARPQGSSGYDENGKPRDAYYACGWLVRPTGDGKENHWHTGSLPGTFTLLVRRHDGLNWAALFNQRTDASGLSYDDIDPALHRAADRVKAWPEYNLFKR